MGYWSDVDILIRSQPLPARRERWAIHRPAGLEALADYRPLLFRPLDTMEFWIIPGSPHHLVASFPEATA